MSLPQWKVTTSRDFVSYPETFTYFIFLCNVISSSFGPHIVNSCCKTYLIAQIIFNTLHTRWKEQTRPMRGGGGYPSMMANIVHDREVRVLFSASLKAHLPVCAGMCLILPKHTHFYFLMLDHIPSHSHLFISAHTHLYSPAPVSTHPHQFLHVQLPSTCLYSLIPGPDIHRRWANVTFLSCTLIVH
jgi:hypothetical protein